MSAFWNGTHVAEVHLIPFIERKLPHFRVVRVGLLGVFCGCQIGHRWVGLGRETHHERSAWQDHGIRPGLLLFNVHIDDGSVVRVGRNGGEVIHSIGVPLGGLGFGRSGCVSVDGGILGNEHVQRGCVTACHAPAGGPQLQKIR